MWLKITLPVIAGLLSFIISYIIEHSSCFVLQNYDTSESKLRREFEVHGPIKKVREFMCSTFVSE